MALLICPSPSPVWKNRSHRQHPKSRLCSKVHPRLLLWGEAESSLRLVSDFLWRRISIVFSLLPSVLFAVIYFHTLSSISLRSLPLLHPWEPSPETAIPTVVVCMGSDKSNISIVWRVLVQMFHPSLKQKHKGKSVRNAVPAVKKAPRISQPG